MPKPHRRADPKWGAVLAVRSRKAGGSLDAADFQVVRRIGRGDVGSVHLVRLRGTNALFAMKARFCFRGRERERERAGWAVG